MGDAMLLESWPSVLSLLASSVRMVGRIVVGCLIEGCLTAVLASEEVVDSDMLYQSNECGFVLSCFQQEFEGKLR